MKIALNHETMVTTISMGTDEMEAFIAEIGVLLEHRYQGDEGRYNRESPTLSQFGFMGAINAAKALAFFEGGVADLTGTNLDRALRAWADPDLEIDP